jgi:hypothetical protein
MGKPYKEWIPVAPNASEGAFSLKNVMRKDPADNQKHLSAEGSQGIKRVAYKTGGFWKNEKSLNGVDYAFFKSPDGSFLRQTGAPLLPIEGLFISIPEGSIIKDVRIVSLKERELEGTYAILPAAKLVVEGEMPEYKEDEAIYGSDFPFPGKHIEISDEKIVAGRTVAHILVYLAQYRPVSKKVTLLESVEFEIIYEDGSKMRRKAAAMECGKPGPSGTNRHSNKSYIHKMILGQENDHATKKSEEDQERASSDTSKLAATAKESSAPDRLQESGAEYIIITTEDLKDSFDSFVESRSKVWTVKVITKEWIMNNFGKSKKEDEAIREFLIYATLNWGTKWVVLGGNIDRIPTHLEPPKTSGMWTKAIASDQYYSDLKGDICPEITVSRFPASTPEDMKNICDNFVNHEQIDGDWTRNCLLAAYEGDPYINCSNQISSSIGNEFNVIKKYGDQSTKEELIEAVNAGVGILNYRGHGKKDRWDSGNGLTNDDVLKLNNGDKMPIVFSIACLTNKIDDDVECFGRVWIRNRKAISFLGATRPSYTDINDEMDQYIFDAILTQKLSRVGEIIEWAIVNLYKNTKDVDACLDTIRSYLLLGDPTAELHCS